MADLGRNRAGGGWFAHSDPVIGDVAVAVLSAAVCSVVGLLLFHGYEEVFGAHTFIFAGYVFALLLLSIGILIRAIYPRLGFTLQFLGITIFLLYYCGVVGAFFPKPFFCLFSALMFMPFLYLQLIRKVTRESNDAVIISGNPGLIDNDARTIRKAKDDFRASTLVSNGLEFFLETWHAEELSASLSSDLHFEQIVTNCLKHEDLQTLGKVLSDLSIRRQPSLWEDLKQCKVPLQLVVGEKNGKFKAIAREMHARIGHENSSADLAPVIEIPSAGHAVHVENPLAVIPAIRQFINREDYLSFVFFQKH